MCDFVCDRLENRAHNVYFCFPKCIFISKQCKEKCPRYAFFIVSRTFFKSGKRGIRTLGALLTHTRFPVVRLRPAQPSFHMVKLSSSAAKGRKKVVRVTGLEPVRRNTRPSNVPVCQFQHTRIHYSPIIAKQQAKVKGIFAFSWISAVCTKSVRKSPVRNFSVSASVSASSDPSRQPYG